jgi:hypothetical protein
MLARLRYLGSPEFNQRLLPYVCIAIICVLMQTSMLPSDGIPALNGGIIIGGMFAGLCLLMLLAPHSPAPQRHWAKVLLVFISTNIFVLVSLKLNWEGGLSGLGVMVVWCVAMLYIGTLIERHTTRLGAEEIMQLILLTTASGLLSLNALLVKTKQIPATGRLAGIIMLAWLFVPIIVSALVLVLTRSRPAAAAA